jgi:hypothetical protein
LNKIFLPYSNVASYSSFSLYDFFNDQKTSLKNSQTLSYNGNSIPTWFIDFHRQGRHFQCRIEFFKCFYMYIIIAQNSSHQRQNLFVKFRKTLYKILCKIDFNRKILVLLAITICCSRNSQTLSYNGNSIPTWFIDFHRQGKIPVFMQNTLVLHRNILLCQVENLKMPSSYNCSLYLIKEII